MDDFFKKLSGDFMPNSPMSEFQKDAFVMNVAEENALLVDELYNLSPRKDFPYLAFVKRGFSVFGKNNSLFGENLRIWLCCRDIFFTIAQDNLTYSIFSKADNSLIVDNIDEYDFVGNFVIVRKNGLEALYSLSGKLIHQGAKDYVILPQEKCFLAFDGKKWSLVKVDGSVVVDGVTSFGRECGFITLGTELKRKPACPEQLRNAPWDDYSSENFILVTHDHKQDLYSIDGTLLQTDAEAYRVLPSKLFFVKYHGHSEDLYKIDGTLLVENISRCYHFERRGWVMVLKDEKFFLYRTDGTLAHSKAKNYEVYGNSSYFWAFDGRKGTLFAQDGTVIADNLNHCKVMSDDFYALKFNDQRYFIIFDQKEHKQFEVPIQAKFELLENRRFKLVQKYHTTLYRADGKVLIDDAIDILCLKNGCYWVKFLNGKTALYDADVNLIVKSDEFDHYCTDYNIVRIDRDYLFDDNGRLVVTSHFGGISSDEQGRYLVKCKKDFYSQNSSIVKELFIFADGWKRVQYFKKRKASLKRIEYFKSNSSSKDLSDIDEQVFFDLIDDQGRIRVKGVDFVCYFENNHAYLVNVCDKFTLFDGNGNVLVEDADDIRYFSDYGVYLVDNDGKKSLVDENGNVLVADADRLRIFRGLYLVERDGQKPEVHFLP